MKTIRLKECDILVDDCDFDWLSQFHWSLFRHTYAIRTKGARGTNRYIFMHREILGLPWRSDNKLLVDHINLNTFDNRRCNLRVTDKIGNSTNRELQSNNTSGFKGVTWCQGKWVAQLKHKGVYVYGGRHETKEQAAAAYDELAVKLFGEFARTNQQLRNLDTV